MHHINRLTALSLRTTLYIIIGLTFAGCGQHTDANDPSAGSVPATTQPPGTGAASTAHTTKSRFATITPDSRALAAFDYKVFEFSNDGSWISLVPMSPKTGNVVIAVNVPGTYEIKLTNEKCASNVNVSPSHGDLFELNAAAPKHLISVNEVMQLKIAMADTAPDNYFCNVAVAVTTE